MRMVAVEVHDLFMVIDIGKADIEFIRRVGHGFIPVVNCCGPALLVGRRAVFVQNAVRLSNFIADQGTSD